MKKSCINCFYGIIKVEQIPQGTNFIHINVDKDGEPCWSCSIEPSRWEPIVKKEGELTSEDGESSYRRERG